MVCRTRGDRPRDINLNIAAAEFDGTIDFYEIAGTGLSTTVAACAERHQAAGLPYNKITVPCRRMAAICAEHVQGDIHFLKIDVEGAEPAVLGGCDFTRFRSWIVLVVAGIAPPSPTPSHQAWEPLLLAAGYEFVLFDGLNRFYVAYEHRALKPALSFRADDYVRASGLHR